ncbi:MAG: endonuclease/exonuclease/phosphatase family protein [Phycisphaerales bacterium]|nr:endonuclease/exonuclease/phosphatase family protein [Phycisphaerales bacterium]MCB9862361.1 endonuclease/exonuclease/phosphatase family protein [Phycisphaerales bacterium]
MRRVVQWLLVVVGGVLAIERYTLRDANAFVAFVYYFAQPIVISGCFFGAAALAWHDRHRRMALMAAVAAIGFAAVWAAQSFGFRGAAAPVGAHRAVVWNVMSGRMGWEAVYSTLGELDADVIVMVEAWEDPETAEAYRRRFLPGYQATGEFSGLVMLSRGELKDVKSGRLGRGSKFVYANIQIGGERIGIIGVDVESDPRRFRKYPLEDLADVAKLHGDGPLVIAGDFNTPSDSVHYAAMRSILQNGFEIAGDGYGPTWPSFAPVLALDQFWVNARVQPFRCVSEWTIRSDHRPVVLEFGSSADAGL